MPIDHLGEVEIRASLALPPFEHCEPAAGADARTVPHSVEPHYHGRSLTICPQQLGCGDSVAAERSGA
jgi:hypothetical protein